ncbi:MAG: hypothetical protein HN392_00860 [Anaerolineae bacterium]|jgi:hypothetical protein|nr:hypothetical protein [Anaerolineae bacterium]MBT7192305.1 hypothetical protein [Anaerolineae bacterium]MBT7783314.1 hypothetical protein [Anaerolineae bacterium]
MSTNFLKEYATARDKLLERIVTSMKEDERFLAAWLTGSFSSNREDNDMVSDLDLTVVISDSHADQLCIRPETITVDIPKARLDLFSQFGKLGFAYENNNNAPTGGAATTVMYLPSSALADWVLIPQKVAQCPKGIKLLFSKVDIPTTPEPEPKSREQRAKEASDMVGFFWLMVAVIAKYMSRNDAVFVVNWLEYLTELVLDMKRCIDSIPDQYQRGSMTRLFAEPAEQLEHLKHLCKQVEILMPEVISLGGQVWPEAQSGVKKWLHMAEQVMLQGTSLS